MDPDGLLNHFAERERHLRVAVSAFVSQLRNNPAVLVVPLADASFEDAFQMYQARTDKQWSLSDCSSFLIMHRYGIVAALTSDSHFEQAGFQALLRG